MAQGSTENTETRLSVVSRKPPATDGTETPSSDFLFSEFFDKLAESWEREATKESSEPMDSSEKYFEERFKRVDDRIEHQNELFNAKIDRVVDKIENMNITLNTTSDKVDKFKANVWWAVLTLFVGLGGLLYMLAQMQNSWLQKYIELLAK